LAHPPLALNKNPPTTIESVAISLSPWRVYAGTDFCPGMADAAPAWAALCRAHALSPAALGPGGHDLAGHRRLGPARDARRHGPLRAVALSRPNACAARTGDVLRRALGGKHDRAGEGSTHVHFAARHRSAQLRDSSRQVIWQLAPDRSLPRGHGADPASAALTGGGRRGPGVQGDADPGNHRARGRLAWRAG